MNHLKAKRRAIYPYICAGCRKERKSLIYDRAVGRLCSVCRRTVTPANQPSLFEKLSTSPNEEKKL